MGTRTHTHAHTCTPMVCHSPPPAAPLLPQLVAMGTGPSEGPGPIRRRGGCSRSSVMTWPPPGQALAARARLAVAQSPFALGPGQAGREGQGGLRTRPPGQEGLQPFRDPPPPPDHAGSGVQRLSRPGPAIQGLGHAPPSQARLRLGPPGWGWLPVQPTAKLGWAGSSPRVGLGRMHPTSTPAPPAAHQNGAVPILLSLSSVGGGHSWDTAGRQLGSWGWGWEGAWGWGVGVTA